MKNIYEIKVKYQNKNGEKEEKIETVKANNNLEAFDKVNKYYKKNKGKTIIDMEII